MNSMLNAFETGQMTLDEYLRRMVFYRERPFTVRSNSKLSFLTSRNHFPNRSLSWERSRRTRRYLLASLNNESREINEYRIDKFKLRDYFEGFFSSCYLGIRKPDAGIYTLALQITQQSSRGMCFDR